MTIRETPLHGHVEIIRVGATGRTTFISKATSLTIRRGSAATGVVAKTDIGLATFTLRNDEDPMADGTLEIGQTLQVVVGEKKVFTGKIMDIAATYPLNKNTGKQASLVTVTVADAVAIHATTPRYGVQIAEGYETFESRLDRLSASALAPIDVPEEGAPIVRYAF